MRDLWITLGLLVQRHKDLKGDAGEYGQDTVIGEGLDALEEWWSYHSNELL